jgi:hypothetical protein
MSLRMNPKFIECISREKLSKANVTDSIKAPSSQSLRVNLTTEHSSFQDSRKQLPKRITRRLVLQVMMLM